MSVRSCLALTATLVFCGCDAAEEPAFPLPVGVYEVRISLAFGDVAAGSAWDVALPAAAGAWLVVDPAEGDRQQLTFFPVEGAGSSLLQGTPLTLERHPSEARRYLSMFALYASSGPAPCDGGVYLKFRDVSFHPVDADGDGRAESIAGTLEGSGSQSTPSDRSGEARPSRPVRGVLRAEPDRTPPALAPVPGPVLPWGPFALRFSEPVIFEDPEFVLEAGATRIPLQSRPAIPTADWDSPASRLDLLQDPDQLHALPPGAPIRLGRLRVYDLARHVVELSPVELGVTVVDPPGRPVPSFEDGRLEGWVTTGPLRAARSSPELPAFDGDWLWVAPIGERFVAVARVDVPDTEAPALELRVGARNGQDWVTPVVHLTVGEGATSIVTRTPVYEDTTVRVELAPFRGGPVTVQIDAGASSCDRPLEGSLLLDSFRIVP